MILNTSVNLLNDLFAFRKVKQMEDDCILDVIKEYSLKKDIDAEELCQELSDYEGFKELVESDLIKHKYIKQGFAPSQQSHFEAPILEDYWNV